VLVVYVGAVLAVSSLSFRFIEKPARRYFNDLAAKKAVAPEARAIA
jgi:peptidoglycan/LPS O-acetylase OafA/YrhL